LAFCFAAYKCLLSAPFFMSLNLAPKISSSGDLTQAKASESSDYLNQYLQHDQHATPSIYVSWWKRNPCDQIPYCIGNLYCTYTV
jgi:hypothetical protein